MFLTKLIGIIDSIPGCFQMLGPISQESRPQRQRLGQSAAGSTAAARVQMQDGKSPQLRRFLVRPLVGGTSRTSLMFVA